MSEVVVQCHLLTKQLLDLLEGPYSDNERDRLMAEVDLLLQKRGVLLPKITPPFNDEEIQLGHEIKQWNRKIDVHLQKLMAMIKQDIQGVNMKKASMSKYTDPYGKLSMTDGMFYDKKN
ncbi:flagellar protein FliT [Bacillus sp. FJAT-52991]|uniref:Flagellar protein FliT n=1 Tax=Bacillus kandeliae TaxID=3129297 RepID=A0ABZ2N4U3_9BACI